MGEIKDKKAQFEKEIDSAIIRLNDILKEYDIVDPPNNVAIVWEDGRLIICLSQNHWAISDK